MKLSSTKHSLVLALVATAILLFQSAAFAIGPTYSGSWYNSEQSGHGFSVEYSVLDDGTPLVVAYWYVYDSEGNPIFLIGTGEPEEDNTVTLEFDAPYGMKFGEFDPESTVRADGGTGVFVFENEKSGTFNYEPSVWISDTYGLSAISIPVKMLLGVAHPNLDPPPTGEPFHLAGLWSGRMVYDRGYAGSGNCYDADVLLNIGKAHYATGDYIKIFDITVDRDGGSFDSFAPRSTLIYTDYVADNFNLFSIIGQYNLRFDDYGLAEGSWKEESGGDCYGTWSFYRDD
jgi:hypothetical protein